MDFKEILKEIQKNLIALVKQKFEGLNAEGKKDMDDFLKSSEEKLKEWTALLISGKLTKEEYQWLIESQKDLLTLHTLYQSGISKLKLEHFKNEVIKTLVTTVVKLIL